MSGALAQPLAFRATRAAVVCWCVVKEMAAARVQSVQWPKLTATMSELYAWAKSLQAGDGMRQLETLDLLIYRWSCAFQTLERNKDLEVLLSKFNEFVGLPKDEYRDGRHGKFHEHSSNWAAPGNRNLAILARLLIPAFTAASNVKTVGDLFEVVTWPWPRSLVFF